MEGVGPDGLDRLRRRRMKVIRTTTIPSKTTPPITPPAIGPASDLLFLAAEVEEAAVELPVAWGTADDSGPPTLSATEGLKVSFVTTSR